MRRIWRGQAGARPTLLLGAAMAVLGAGALLVGSSLPAADHAEFSRGVAPIDAGAHDPRDIRAHNSPSLVRNPRDATNLVVSNRVDSPAFSCALHVSLDGGVSWRETAVPIPAGEEDKCYAPDVAFGADGTLYVSYVTLQGAGNVPNAGWVVSSNDQGRSLSTPVKALGPRSFQVRVLADATTPGLLYLSWLQAGGVATLGFSGTSNAVNVARSIDGGVTWEPPTRVDSSSRSRPLAPSMALGPQGALYIAYLDLGDDALDYSGAHAGRGGDPYPGLWTMIVARSTDLGRNWHEAVVDDRLVPAERLVALIPPFPSLAADPKRGSVHVAFTDGRAGDPDVWLGTSEDGGVTWAPPQRVNDTPPTDGTSQYLPKLAISAGGRLDVVYYDRRADPDNVANEVSLQSSSDGGRTFTSRTPLSDRAFDSRIGFGSERGLPDLGSRLGLVSSDDEAVAIWTDTRGGTEASNKQDLAVVAVRFPGTGALARSAPLLWAGGAALVVAGLGFAAVGFARRRLPPPLDATSRQHTPTTPASGLR